MRCYKVTTTVTTEHGMYDLKHYAETQADAATIKKEWMEKYNLKRTEVDVEKEEIPLAKGELLAFINNLLVVTE